MINRRQIMRNNKACCINLFILLSGGRYKQMTVLIENHDSDYFSICLDVYQVLERDWESAKSTTVII